MNVSWEIQLGKRNSASFYIQALIKCKPGVSNLNHGKKVHDHCTMDQSMLSSEVFPSSDQVRYVGLEVIAQLQVVGWHYHNSTPLFFLFSQNSGNFGVPVIFSGKRII